MSVGVVPHAHTYKLDKSGSSQSIVVRQNILGNILPLQYA